MPWGAVAGAVVGGLINSDASRSAANKQKDATKYAADMQWKMYDQTRADNLPALDARNTALKQLQLMLGVGGDPKAAGYGSLMQQFTGEDLQNDPGYQFGLTQGNQAIERSASARGGLYSGATLKALQRYGQDYAGTKFGEAFNRNQSQNDSAFNRFASLAGLGQTGSSQIATAGQNAANMAGGYGIQGANAQAAAGMNQANIWGNVGNQLGAWASRNWGSGSTYNHPEYNADGTGMWYSD